MLEAIADFWKPIKRAADNTKNRLAELNVGSVVSFGYMPQMALSSKKLTVSAINSYQFGTDVLTSFVFSQNGHESGISMIVADAQGEQYLAISRKLSAADRARLFAEHAVEDVISRTEVTKLHCKDNIPELKGWLVADYKREIQGMHGFLHRADLRAGSEKLQSGDEFSYSLLGSDSNEHALEIESYPNGKIEVYATIYRRTSDIADISNQIAALQQKPEVKLVAQNGEVSPVAKSLLSGVASQAEVAPVVASEAVIKEEPKAEPKNAAHKTEPHKAEVVKLEEVALPELTPTPLAPAIEKIDAEKIAAVEEKSPVAELPKQENNNNNIKNNEEKSNMTISTATNGNNNGYYNGGNAANKVELGIVSKSIGGVDGETINCDLKVANQIIEEAIRNEMRLSDVVRRIVELPVAHQETVQIPFTLSDEDYSLLAIRYGIPASDRNAIKTRIIQDLGDFSGNKRK